MIVACGKDTQKKAPLIKGPGYAGVASSAGFVDVSSKGGGTYKLAVAAEVSTETDVVLFFGKSGDPFTKRTDQMLRALYGSGSVAKQTRYIDYDKSMSLRLQNEVITYDTLVLRVKGEILKSIVHPSQSELQLLLK